MNDLDVRMAVANPVDAADLTYGARQEALLRRIADEPASRSRTRLGVARTAMSPRAFLSTSP